ncbi:hypothetical protein GCM10028791_36000 [Echinicola sediminis]
MKNISLIIGITLFLLLTACEKSKRENREVSEPPGTVAPGPSITDSDVFEPSYEDIEKDRINLDKDLKKLKAERQDRIQGDEGAQFDKLISEAESKINDIGEKAKEFQQSSEEVRNEIYDEIKEIKKQFKDKLKEIENRFDKNK